MSSKTIKIAVIPGDGIGTEVMVYNDSQMAELQKRKTNKVD